MPLMRPTSILCASLLAVLSACASDPGAGEPMRMSADPDTVAGDYLQGRFAASRQQYNDASSAFSRVVIREDNADLTASAFRYSLAAGEFSQARSYAAEMLTSDPQGEEGDDLHHTQPALGFLDEDLPRLTIAADAFRTEEYALAADTLKAPFNSSLGRAIGHVLEGWSSYAEEGIGAAVATLNDVEDDTFAGFAPFHLAMMLDLDGQAEAAGVTYGEAMRLPGADIAMLGYAGFVEREIGRDEALKVYGTLAGDRGFRRRLGRLGLARLGEPLKGETREFRRLAAKGDLRLADSAKEGAAIVFANFAWSAYDEAVSRHQSAAAAGFGDIPLNLEIPLTLAQLAVAIDEDMDVGYYLIGAISAYYEQYDVSDAAYGRVAPGSWLYNYAVIDRAEALVAMGRRSEAIDLIDEYLDQDALAPDVYLELADLYVDDDRIDDALGATDDAIRTAEQLTSEQNRDDNLWRYYFAKGAIAAEADRWTVAEPNLTEALALSPDEPLLLNYLGYSYVERGENLDQAFAMIERALEARPASGAITDSLGWAYYQRGDYEDAVRYLERAVELEPGDDTITDHLGDAYWQVGRKAEARFEWRRVLEIENIDEELRSRVERKLDGEPPAPGHLVGNNDGD